MPYKPDGSPPLRGRCPKDREGLLIIMKNKDLWRNIIQVVVSILTADLSLSLNDMFKKGWNSPIIIRNDYKKEGRESCSIQIRYLEDKDEYCFLIYDVKGGRVLPKEWQTLKSWKNGKKVFSPVTSSRRSEAAAYRTFK